ncbi:MAG: hypothetical protein ACYSW7_05315 [Planctomycetota bacterium]|jgi:hypothetical protein
MTIVEGYMGIFSKKETVDLRDFCRNVYDKMLMNQVDYANSTKKILSDIDKVFSSLDNAKLTNHLLPLQFELFALGWTHKFQHGIIVVSQSAFTKQYLNEKQRDDIWADMEEYNKCIHSATLNWLTGLGKVNLAFNYNMIKNLSANNIKDAQEAGIITDDIIQRVNNRVWSENSCKQKLFWGAFLVTFCMRLDINWNELSQDKRDAVMEYLLGNYYGAKQLLKNIKIKN